ncbi:MAG: DUF1307 domain-containing protein [Bacilli bacterium]|nr:DUF1307 domain-containing protein [Bacilli bacterium]
MKKIVCLSVLLLLVFTLTGCEKAKVMKCSRTSEISETMKISTEFKITYVNNTVKKVSTIEKLTSKEGTYLEAYKTSVESTYAPYDDIKYYNYDIEIEDDTLITKVNIDYSKIDLKELIKADTNNSELISEGKIDFKKLVELYKSIGSTCK